MARWCLFGILFILFGACSPQTGAPPPPAPETEAPTAIQRDLVLGTTTSTQDSGLLDVLVPLFERQTGYQLKTVSVGTGAALALGARGEADVLLVHAPEVEQQWMAEGNGTDRRLVMHNDFVIVGPRADPAGLTGVSSPAAALQRIAAREGTWVSRDDNSGTDQLEKPLWRQAGIDPSGNAWYLASGQGMGATLTLTDQKGAYTLSDRATYLARRNSLDSVVLVEGDPQLLNVYHVMPVSPAKLPDLPINARGGQAFADFMVSPDTQKVISEFGVEQYGQPLFFPDAGKAEEQLRP